MPADEWRKATLRATYGPAPVPEARPRRSRKTRKRARKPKNTFVPIGACAVLEVTRRSVRVCLPDGRAKWLPRTVLMNGNMRFAPGQVIHLHCARWCARREGVPEVERIEPHGGGEPVAGVTPPAG